MHIGMRSRFATSKILKALLLGVVPIALAIPAGEVAFSQSATWSVARGPLFTAIDLNPSGFVESWATGASEGRQVGYGYGPATGGYGHALLWHGTAASAVDLHPSGFMTSRILGISGAQQVGVGISPQLAAGSHALLWHGSSAAVVDLNPRGFVRSEASGISGGQQVGWGYGPTTGDQRHALLWSGSAATVVDLHPDGFETSEGAGASSGQQVGWGTAGDCQSAGQGCHYHALLWRGTASGVVDLGEGKTYGTSGDQHVGWGARGNAVLWTGSAGGMVDLQPYGFYGSTASGTSGGEQVGYGGPWTQTHALLWRGDVSSLVDLHASLPPGFAGSTATGIDSNGDVVGVAWGPATDNKSHAFLWTRNASAKPSLVHPVDKFTTFYSPLTSKALGVYTGSPAELLLMDPLGNQSGFDPITKTSTPGYEVSVMCDESPGGTGGCKPPFKQLDMGAPMDGQYTLDVIGTGTGDFDVEVRISDTAGNWISHSYSGMTAPGRITRISFPGEVITFAAFGATVKINLATKTFEVNGTFSLGPGGTISPVTQPVTVELHFLYLTIPAGSFRQDQQGTFVFEGTTAGVALVANLMPMGGNGYTFKIKGVGADLAGDRMLNNNPYPIRVMLAIGNNGGSSDVKIEYAH